MGIKNTDYLILYNFNPTNLTTKTESRIKLIRDLIPN